MDDSLLLSEGKIILLGQNINTPWLWEWVLKCVVIGIGLFRTLKNVVVEAVVVVVAAGVVGHMLFVFQYIHPSSCRSDKSGRQSYKSKLGLKN